MDNLQINKVAKDSSVIKLEFKDYAEGRALNFLKLYLLGYSKEYNKRQNLETDSKLEQLRKQKNDLEKELNDAMSKVAVFQVDNNLMAPDVIGKSETELVLNNQEKFFETQVNKLQIEKALHLINEDKYGEITNYGIFSDNINIQNLLKDLITLKSEKDALLVDYTENHPSVIAKSNKIKAIKNEIQNYLERNLENNAIISDNLKKNIDKKIRTLQTLPKNKLILDSLQQKMTINNKLLATLIEEEATLLIDKKGENSEFKIIEEPRIIYPPLKASATLIYLESLAVGMIIYFFLALILYKMEKRLYGINQIIRHMSVSKYFSVFENEINLSNDKIKKIINLLLIETEYNDKNTYFIFSDNNKISQKIAFFIFKISMKKTITVDLDNCIQTLRAVILNKSLHSSHLIKDENTIENYRFMKFDVLEEHHEDEYINISALKEILYASFENIIFITTKEMRYIQPEDYVILNVWQKITSLHFIHDLTEYFQQKKIKNTFLVFFNWQPHSSAIKSQLVKFGTRNIFPLLCLTPFIFSGCQTKNNFLETNGTIYKQYIYEEYKLKKGDRLAVSFYKKGEAKDGLPEPYNGITPFIVSTIKEDGSITLPLIGRSELEGLTLEKAEEMLCERFKFYYRNPVVALELQDAKIFVLGEVNNPGVVKINSARVNLVEAIASAGDFNTASNKKNIKIIKDINTNPSIAEVDLTQMNNFAGSNIFLNPSDVVYVSSTNVQIFNDKFTETFPFLNMVNQALDAALSRKNITRP
jgi:polysaccharide export outer membrane protein